MIALRFAFALCLFSGFTSAADYWAFEPRIAVSDPAEEGTFHHLDGAGRRHIAISGATVAVVWEDNRSGDPQVYAASKPPEGMRFGEAVRISDGTEAYEPAIVAIGNDRFAIAWEQDSAVYLQLFDGERSASRLQLGGNGSSHAALAFHGGRLYSAWRERRDGAWFIKVAAIDIDTSGELTRLSVTPVEASGIGAAMQYPALVVNDEGVCIAWEDRRAGHTRLLVSHNLHAEPGFSGRER